MNSRRWELVTADESAVIAKPFLDAIMVKNLECDGCFPDPPCTNQSDRFQVFCKPDNVVDESVTSEASPGWRGREFPNKDTK